MTAAGVLVVGASHAGLAIATGLRDLGFAEPITIVGAEARLPYDRPPLSKQYLLGAVGDDDILLRAPDFYESAQIRVATSEWISDVDLDDGLARSTLNEYEFEHLAIATGASARTLRIPGSDLPGVLYLRTARDATSLGHRLGAASDIVIVGGGYIGLEAASVISQLGKRVTVVETAPTLIPRAARPALSSYLAELHRGRGITVELGAAVEGFEGGATGVRAVALSDGRWVAADLVLVGIGIIPNVELGQRLGLVIDGGIVVDASSTTSDPRVVAAGDVTAMRSGTSLIRHESVHNASVQGTAAARTIMGLGPGQQETPWFWSNQFDVKIQMAGRHDPALQPITRGDVSTHSFSVLYLDDVGRLRAIDCVNRPGDFLAGRRAIDAGQSIDPRVATDVASPLRDAIR